MYLCYLDESGVPEQGNSTHYVLVGLAIPIWQWRNCDDQIQEIKWKYSLGDAEMHVAWMLRKYLEQSKIPDFERMDYARRRYEVNALRAAELYRLQRVGTTRKLYHQTRKNFNKTDAYVHLTYDQRKAFVKEVAQRLGRWAFVRLFAECVDKVYFDPSRREIDEQAFEQIVTRFERYLQNVQKRERGNSREDRGLLIHDNNETVALKHTRTMRRFHERGTLYSKIDHIYETPLFVDSQLTSMVQLADLCGYALRRYLENGEEDLFDCVYPRGDRNLDVVVGVRHYTHKRCVCKICEGHRRESTFLNPQPEDFEPPATH